MSYEYDEMDADDLHPDDGGQCSDDSCEKKEINPQGLPQQQHQRAVDLHVSSDDISLQKNKLFQENMDKVNDETLLEQEEAFGNLAQLSKDFVASALTFGQIIIAERFLADHQKTIKPEPSLGGMAGGEKYMCQCDVLYRRAED